MVFETIAFAEFRHPGGGNEGIRSAVRTVRRKGDQRRRAVRTIVRLTAP
jgi:hypothetical protein